MVNNKMTNFQKKWKEGEEKKLRDGDGQKETQGRKRWHGGQRSPIGFPVRVSATSPRQRTDQTNKTKIAGAFPPPADTSERRASEVNWEWGRLD
jgi:hypothetical protein